MIGRLFKDFIHPRRFIRLGRTIRLENNRRVKFSKTRPKDGIIIGGRGCAVQRLQGSFLISSRERNFTKPFVSVDVTRIERDRSTKVPLGFLPPPRAVQQDCPRRVGFGQGRVQLDRFRRRRETRAEERVAGHVRIGRLQPFVNRGNAP